MYPSNFWNQSPKKSHIELGVYTNQTALKSILMITAHPFWREHNGCNNRITALVDFLKDFTNLTILYAGSGMSEDRVLMQGLGLKLEYLEERSRLSREDYLIRLADFFIDRHFDFCIVEFLTLAFIRKFIPPNIKTLLDTHDVMSSKKKSFERFGYTFEQIDATKEIKAFMQFDKVMLIQEEEYDKVARIIGSNKALLVPHPVSGHNMVGIRKKSQAIGFIGASNVPNVDSLKWFLDHVFPKIPKSITLNIYGKVCDNVKGYTANNLCFHGYVKEVEPIYASNDLFINPVRIGAGLKIKNIEALGFGVPLITTSHGASGLQSEAGKSFFIADSAQEFIDGINVLVRNYETRKAMGSRAHTFIKERFNRSSCFASLKTYLLQY